MMCESGFTEQLNVVKCPDVDTAKGTQASLRVLSIPWVTLIYSMVLAGQLGFAPLGKMSTVCPCDECQGATKLYYY